MKKKMMFVSACCLTMLLSGCAKEKTTVCKNSLGLDKVVYVNDINYKNDDVVNYKEALTIKFDDLVDGLNKKDKATTIKQLKKEFNKTYKETKENNIKHFVSTYNLNEDKVKDALEFNSKLDEKNNSFVIEVTVNVDKFDLDDKQALKYKDLKKQVESKNKDLKIKCKEKED